MDSITSIEKDSIIEIPLRHKDASNRSIINSLEVADGIKDSLIKYGYTWKQLLKSDASSISNSLGIDEYIAKLILSAVFKQKQKKSLESAEQKIK